MIKAGFIGYGSMGRMLLHELISSGGLVPGEVIVSTRTKEKLIPLKEKWPAIDIAEDNGAVAKRAQYIFICVPQREVKNVLEELKGSINSATHIISLAGSVSIQNIEKLISGKITKITPSIASEIHSGITLVCHNDQVREEDGAFVESLLGKISTVKVLKEKDLGLAIQLTSCAPGFIAAIFKEFVDAGLKYNATLNNAEIEEMVAGTLLGTAKLIAEKNMGFEEVISRVAVKGGITEEGVEVLHNSLPKIFDELFQVILTKRNKICDLVDNDFNEVTG